MKKKLARKFAGAIDTVLQSGWSPDQKTDPIYIYIYIYV